MKSLLCFPFLKDIVIHPSNSIFFLAVIIRIIMMVTIYYALYVPGTIYVIFFACTADP